MYQADLGRFPTLDRFADKYYGYSPYQYAVNNPLKFIDVNGDSTYLIIYGSGWVKPSAKGKNNDVGQGFRLSAEAREKELRESGVLKEGDNVVVVYAATEGEYINGLNTEYESGVIKQLDVYTHGSNNSLNLGGPTGGSDDYDYRLVSAMSSAQNTDGNNELLRINRDNFSENAQVDLWGCQLGGTGAEDRANGMNHAQKFADHLGPERTVKAFNGGGGSEFQARNGQNVYKGKMIRSADRATQTVNQTVYIPR